VQALRHCHFSTTQRQLPSLTCIALHAIALCLLWYPLFVAFIAMSLTPADKSEETVGYAVSEGLLNSMFTILATGGGVAIAMRNPNFRMRTNWQVRRCNGEVIECVHTDFKRAH
jgi:hypothetical protein